MSSERGNWQLAEARRQELLRAEALKQACDAGKKAQKSLEGAFIELRKAGALCGDFMDAVAVPKFPENSQNREDFEAYVKQALESIGQVQAETKRAEALAELQLLAAERVRPLKASPVTTPSPQTSDADEVTGTVKRLVGRSPTEMMSTSRAEIERIIDRLLNATPAQREELLQDLRVQVQEAQKRRRAEEQIAKAGREAAAAMLEKMRGLESPELGGIRIDLEKASTGEISWTPALERQAHLVAERETKRTDASYVATVLAEEFGKFGYDVGETFVTAVVEGGKIVMTVPNAPDDPIPPSVAVELVVRDAALDFDLFRYAGSASPEQEARNEAAARRWCKDLKALRDNIQSRGITLKLEEVKPPKLSTMRTVMQAASPSPGETRRKEDDKVMQQPLNRG